MMARDTARAINSLIIILLRDLSRRGRSSLCDIPLELREGLEPPT